MVRKSPPHLHFYWLFIKQKTTRLVPSSRCLKKVQTSVVHSFRSVIREMRHKKAKLNMEVKQRFSTYLNNWCFKGILRREGISVSQKLPEISTPWHWMWKDGRIGKAEKKKWGERNSKITIMKALINKTFQGKVYTAVTHFAIGLVSETIGWKGPTLDH